MIGSDLVMYEEEFRRIDEELQKLHQQSNAKVVFRVAIFDNRSSLGLVRLRVKKASEFLTKIFDEITHKAEKEKKEGKFEEFPFAEISDEDIDNLFR